MTLRTRLILLVMALAVSLVLGIGLYVGGSVRAWSREALDSELEQQANALSHAAKLEHGRLEIEEDELESSARRWPYRIETLSGDVLAQSGRYDFPPLPASVEEPSFQTVPPRVGPAYRVFTASFEPRRGHGQRWVVRVAAPVGTFTELERRFRTGMLTGLALAALLSLAGAALIARLFLEPMHRLSREVAGIGAEALDQRLTVKGLDPELGRLASAFNGVLDRLQRAFDVQRAFVARASHSLRTPVASILSTAEVAVRRERPAEEYRAALEEIALSARDSARLAEGLLALSRAEQRDAIRAPERVELPGLFTELQRLFRTHAELAGIAFEAKSTPGLCVTVDRTSLREMLDALVDNAIRYTPAGGRVTLTSQVEGDDARIDVTDTGPGIRPEEREKVFDRFFRGSAAEASKAPGSGLGLALVRALAEAEKVRVELGDAPGGGTRVTLRMKRS